MGAENSGPAASGVVVYLTGRAAPVTTPYLRSEAAGLLESAGYAVVWRDSHDRRGLDAGNLIVVELAGDCTPGAAPNSASTPVQAGRSLATTMVQDGSVLPFARVDCAAVTDVLAPLFNREAPARRNFLYGRALGRLIAHELYHAIARTRDHAPAGIGKPCFSAADLVSERFEFEAVAVERLRHAADADEGVAEATGRQ